MFQETYLLAIEIGVIEQMSIDVERDVYARMSKLALNVLNVLASGDSHARVRVP